MPNYPHASTGGPGTSDPELAVGPDHIVGISNQEIGIWSKTGAVINKIPLNSVPNVDPYGFFMVDPQDEITFFDPEVLYDGAESSSNDRRFWAMGTRLSKGSGTGIEGAFYVAVSKTCDPTGDWWIYTFPVPEAYHDFIHLDSANMSVDDDWVYLNGIVRERDYFSEVYRYFNITYIIDKHDMMAGNGVLEYEIQESWTTTSEGGIDTWVKNGLVVNFSYPPEQYMIDARFDDDLTFDEVDLWRIDFDIVDPGPTKVKRTISLPSGAEYREPSDAIPQLNSSAVLDPFDSRFFTAVYRDGYLWAVHHVRPEDDPRTVIRWYRFAMNGWSVTSPSSYPTLDGWGTIAVGTAQNPIHLFQPSIAVDDEGNAAITYARSAAGEYPSIWMSRTDTTGAFSIHGQLHASSAPWEGGSQFADFRSCEPDPDETGRFWGHHQYQESTGSPQIWKTRIRSQGP